MVRLSLLARLRARHWSISRTPTARTGLRVRPSTDKRSMQERNQPYLKLRRATADRHPLGVQDSGCGRGSTFEWMLRAAFTRMHVHRECAGACSSSPAEQQASDGRWCRWANTECNTTSTTTGSCSDGDDGELSSQRGASGANETVRSRRRPAWIESRTSQALIAPRRALPRT
ncbi:hypothetical protein BU25DRAFT_273323 [Macroventuria anomochaeta]|uniref:Uncharacterized protein n=1 Tax=Macroventuria anomochaeta TaxID=301207 RepID=A0ACB6S6U3_9PLEO|nr:uncharacterized protein BU25DRAFT_273323 [Macroventuria anomochaeta]KAF2629732.1 hypothetical protein BU25DRAFT_273323 [Macroventuria anomochaeta]